MWLANAKENVMTGTIIGTTDSENIFGDSTIIPDVLSHWNGKHDNTVLLNVKIGFIHVLDIF